MPVTLGDLVSEGLSPVITCRACGGTVEGGTLALAAFHGRDYPLARYLRRLRCRKCGNPPDVALVWQDDGAAARAGGHAHVRWQLVRNDGEKVG